MSHSEDITFGTLGPGLATAIADGTRVYRGDRVAIALTGIEAYELALTLVEECLSRGALPQVVLAAEDFERSALQLADDDTIRVAAPLELAAIEWADVYIALRAMTIPRTPADATNVSPTRQVAQRLAKGQISTARWKQTRWCVVRVPTTAWSQRAGVNGDRMLKEFIDGCTQDWASCRHRWELLCEQLQTTNIVTIVDADTDLKLRTTGRLWVPFYGEMNLPDGEIATAPLDDATEGHITFPASFWFADIQIRDLRMDFVRGRCVRIRARQGQAFVEQLVAADDGASVVGELGIGTNPDMHTMIGDLFLDEKILGTAHIAMGRAYPQCGGTNRSSIHWDIVKDLRHPSAMLFADDIPLIEAGQIAGPLAGATSAPHERQR